MEPIKIQFSDIQFSDEKVTKGDVVYRSDENSLFVAGSTITDAYIECPNMMGAEGVRVSVCRKVVGPVEFVEKIKEANALFLTKS
jgi:hypothetical protein